jgi:hypothetical protein
MRGARRWRALHARILQYYSCLMNDVPQDFIEVLRPRLAERPTPPDAPKIDRLRPGGTPHVRMPSRPHAKSG